MLYPPYWLIPELLDMLEGRKIVFNQAYEQSVLKPIEQEILIEAMDYAQGNFSFFKYGGWKNQPEWTAFSRYDGNYYIFGPQYAPSNNDSQKFNRELAQNNSMKWYIVI